MAPPRILFAVRKHFYPASFAGGAQRSAHRLLICLAKDYGVKCMALARLTGACKIPPPSSRRALGIRSVRRHHGRWDFDCGYPIRLVEGDFDTALEDALEDFRPTVLLAESDGALMTLQAGLAHGVPGVLSFRNDIKHYAPEQVRAAAEAGQRFVCNSDYIRRWARRTYGVRSALSWPIVDRTQYRVAWDPGGCLTMFNPHPAKGISTFLSLAGMFAERRFLLVEGWPLSPEQRRDIDSGLAHLPNVTFCPRVSDVRNILRQTALLLVPSLWQESSARVAMEAQISGIPVIASSVGGLPTYVGKGGILIKDYRNPHAWAKTIRALLNNLGRMKALSKAALKNSRREEFSENRNVRRFYDAIRQAQESARPAP